MATARERLVEWLRDAHSTEEQAKTMLKGTARQMREYPQFEQRLQEQAEIAARHAVDLERCLADLGESPSMVKEMTGKFVGVAQTLSGLVVGDEVMKAALATETFAQMEAASYRILVSAAEAAGEPQIRSSCERMLADEVDFAGWVDQQLPMLTTQYLYREQSGRE
jgi:ferritin-like metal-binding protein YciE